MMRIFVIDHRPDDHQPIGPVIQPWRVWPTDQPGERYTDYTALYGAWTGYNQTEPPEHIGFFGYRKYLITPDCNPSCSPGHNPRWFSTGRADFNRQRTEFWRSSDGRSLLPLLATHDVLVAAPYRLHATSLIDDFRQSRSVHDGDKIAEVMHNYPLNSRNIYPYLFVTRWSVFDRMMREMEKPRQQLDSLITTEDSVNPEYKKRPMAYVMERVFSLWLESSGLSIAELPLLHCWEMP